MAFLKLDKKLHNFYKKLINYKRRIIVPILIVACCLQITPFFQKRLGRFVKHK